MAEDVERAKNVLVVLVEDVVEEEPKSSSSAEEVEGPYARI